MMQSPGRAKAFLAWGLDVLICMLVAAWVHSELFGGVRVHVVGVALSNRDAFRMAFEVLAVAGLRWWLALPAGLLGRVFARPTPSVPTALGNIPWRLVLLVVVVSRLAVWGVGWWSTLQAEPSGQALRDLALTRAQERPVLYLQGRWDSGWYATIALDGYSWDPTQPTRQQNVAFYPGYPLLMRAVAEVVEPMLDRLGVLEAVGDSPGVRLENLGAVVSVLLFIVALRWLWHLARADLGDARAAVAVLFAACWPFSYFFSASYTESLYLFGLAGAFYFGRTRVLGLAFVCGLVVGLTRQVGFLMCLPLMLDVVIRARRDRVALSPFAVFAAMAPLCGASLYWGYLWRTFGDPFAWVSAQRAWLSVDRYARWQEVSSLAEYVDQHPYDFINLSAALMAALLLWRTRRWAWSYVALGALSLAVPLYMDVVPLGRMTAPLFPIYLGLATLVSNRLQVVALLVVLFALQLLAAGAFYGWQPLY